MLRAVGLSLLLVILSTASVDAQRRDGSDDRDGPVETLLELRATIGLTDAQVARLEEIDAEMQRQNDPLVSRLVELRRSIRALGRRHDFTPEQQAQYDVYIAEARPLMKQIRENNNAAMRQIGTILTEPQRAQVAEILRERDDDDDRRGDSRDRRRD